MKIDVTHKILAGSGRGSIYSVHRQITNWLEENVGEFYLSEEQPDGTLYKGAGWDFGSEHIWDKEDNVSISWWVDITDEKLSTLFALRWA
jgi:hypothetical protein